jgi:hypothetical protein
MRESQWIKASMHVERPRGIHFVRPENLISVPPITMSIPLKRTLSQTQSSSISDQQPPTRRKLNMPLEHVPNVLDEATHASLDTKVSDKARHRRLGHQDLTPGELSLLLKWIASNSNGCIDEKFADDDMAFELLDGNEELQASLTVAWGERSFKDIRNLSTLPVL